MANKYHNLSSLKTEREALRHRGVKALADDPRTRTPAVYNRDVKKYIKKTGGWGT